MFMCLGSLLSSMSKAKIGPRKYFFMSITFNVVLCLFWLISNELFLNLDILSNNSLWYVLYWHVPQGYVVKQNLRNLNNRKHVMDTCHCFTSFMFILDHLTIFVSNKVYIPNLIYYILPIIKSATCVHKEREPESMWWNWKLK